MQVNLAMQTEQMFSHCCPHVLMSQRIHIEFAHPRASDGIRIHSSVHGSSAIKCTVERAIGQGQKTFRLPNLQRSLNWCYKFSEWYFLKLRRTLIILVPFSINFLI